jgi:hypothetical protein
MTHYKRAKDHRRWIYECPDGDYDYDTLLGLLWGIVAHRWWHFRRGEGWRD